MDSIFEQEVITILWFVELTMIAAQLFAICCRIVVLVLVLDIVIRMRRCRLQIVLIVLSVLIVLLLLLLMMMLSNIVGQFVRLECSHIMHRLDRRQYLMMMLLVIMRLELLLLLLLLRFCRQRFDGRFQYRPLRCRTAADLRTPCRCGRCRCGRRCCCAAGRRWRRCGFR